MQLCYRVTDAREGYVADELTLRLPEAFVRLISCLSLLLLIAVSPAASQFGMQVWTINNGLPQNEVRSVTQTPDGLLWIATMDGLVRFDGLKFTLFNRGNTPGISSNRMTGIENGSDGDLWITYESGGLLRVHEGRFQSLGTREGVPGVVVSATSVDEKGQVWILSEGQVYRWDQVRAHFEPVPELNRRRYGPLVWDIGGFVAYDQEKVYCFTRGRLITFALPDRLKRHHILRVGLDPHQNAWLELANGQVVHLSTGIDTTERSSSTEEVYLGQDGQRWRMHVAGDLTRSLRVTVGGRNVIVPFRHALADMQGNLWLATEGAGLFRFHRTPVTVLDVQQGLLDQDVYPIFEDKSGAVWMGTWHKGLSRFLNGRFTNYTIVQGLPSPLVTALFEDREDRLWVGTDGGLSIYRNGRFVSARHPSLPDRVQAIYQTHDGTLWFGMRTGGLAEWKNGVLRIRSPAGGGAPFDIHVITESADGSLWVGGSDGLMQLSRGQVVHWSEANGLSSNRIWSLYPEDNGTLWIGTYDGGLVRLKEGRITRFTTQNGLFSDGVFQILDDGLGNLWMSCNMGIYRAGKRDLDEVADGSRRFVSSVDYGKEDGIANLEANGGLMPAGVKTKDGKLWFPTQSGVVLVDPRRISSTPGPPNAVVESAFVDQLPAPLNRVVRMAATEYTIALQYTAPDFDNPEKLRFRYKLEGLDDDWTEAGQRRAVTYTHLPEGHYTFVVSASNGNGVWGANSARLPIYVAAPYYRTSWFRFVVVLILAASTFAGSSYWLSQLRRRQSLQNDFMKQLITSQEEERQRIAGELHDSLGQRLMFINGIARLALRTEMNRAVRTQEGKALQQVSEEALAAMQETRAISYDLRPIYLDRLGLTQAINQLAQQASAASSISIEAELDDMDDLLPADQNISLYRIVQEAISNILKYSGATHAAVRAVRSGGQLTMTISDDGKGFAVSNNLNKEGRIGMGLRGMAERASLIGASFKVAAAPGEGTVIWIELFGGATEHR